MSMDGAWWADVSATSPLTVVRSGQTPGAGEDVTDLLALDGPPGIEADTLVSGLAVGDRVWCQSSDGTVVIIGRSGG